MESARVLVEPIPIYEPMNGILPGAFDLPNQDFLNNAIDEAGIFATPDLDQGENYWTALNFPKEEEKYESIVAFLPSDVINEAALDGNEHVQFNQYTERFEIVKGREIRLRLNHDLEEMDILTFKVKSFHYMKALKTQIKDEAPFSIRASHPNSQVEHIKNDDHHEYRVSGMKNGIRDVFITFNCYSSEGINGGNVEKNRKWFLEIGGKIGESQVDQKISLQVVKMLRRTDRLKKPTKKSRVNKRAPNGNDRSSVLQHLKGFLMTQLDSQLDTYSTEELTGMMALQKRIKIRIE